MSKTVAVLVGSLRRDSFAKKTAAAIASLAPADMTLEIVPIGDLPFYNEDLETDSPPPQWTEFRRKVKAADALLCVTPEYNRSMPGVLKNALDVGSRPYGKAVFDGKPGAVVSISMGGIGGFGANHHLRQSLVCLHVLTLQQPEAYIGNVKSLFDENGRIKAPATEEYLHSFVRAFDRWIEKQRG